MQRNWLGTGRTIAQMLFICIVLALLLSFGFIAVHTDHECTGEHCEVCEKLVICINMIQKTGFLLTVFLFGSIAYLTGAAYTFFSETHYENESTPVQLKVKMNN